MVAYLQKENKLMGTFPTASIEVIPQSNNANTDALAKLASTRDAELLDAVSILGRTQHQATARSNRADTRAFVDGSYYLISKE